ncbi:FixH family protein [Myxococcota bacterium]|nr:FixH family protein [Myxococcota bacterium]
MTRVVSIALFALALSAGCMDGHKNHHSAMDSLAEVDESREASSASYTVTITPSPDPIPFNDYFDLTASIVDGAGAPVTDATVSVSAEMPSHGHGMTVTPTTTSNGDGTYTTPGMLFSMSGVWVITLSITGDQGTETVEFNVVI